MHIYKSSLIKHLPCEYHRNNIELGIMGTERFHCPAEWLRRLNYRTNSPLSSMSLPSVMRRKMKAPTSSERDKYCISSDSKAWMKSDKFLKKWLINDNHMQNPVVNSKRHVRGGWVNPSQLSAPEHLSGRLRSSRTYLETFSTPGVAADFSILVATCWRLKYTQQGQSVNQRKVNNWFKFPRKCIVYCWSMR